MPRSPHVKHGEGGMAGTGGSPSPPPRRWHQLERGRYRCALRGAPGPHLRHPLRAGGAAPPAWRPRAAAARERRPAAGHRRAARFSKPALHPGTAFGVKLWGTGYSFLLKTWRFNRTLGWGGAEVRVPGMGPQQCGRRFSPLAHPLKLYSWKKKPGATPLAAATRVSNCFKAAKSFCRRKNCGQAPESNLERT